MSKISIENIKKCDKKIVDSYIFSLYLAKLKNYSYIYCFLVKKEEGLFLITDNKEIFYNLKLNNIEKIIFVENTIKTTMDTTLKSKKKSLFLDYEYAEQILKIISSMGKEEEFLRLDKLFSLCCEDKPLLLCFSKVDSEYVIHINQVKNCDNNGDYSLPLFLFDLKNIYIQHNIYRLENWDIFKRFNMENIHQYNFKLPECYFLDVCKISSINYKNIKK